jgi:signal recognition particle GTPase
MARDWQDLFITRDGAAPAAEDTPQETEKRRGFFRRLRENMRKTREAMTSEITSTLFEDINEETWEKLEEALIAADVGARTTAEIVEQLEQEADAGNLVGGEALTARLQELLADVARVGDPTIDLTHEPTVMLIVGVNGTGKTTSVGKIAGTCASSSTSRSCSAPPTLSARPPSSSSRSGPSAPASRSSRARPTPTRAPSPTKPSPRASATEPTSS